MEILALIPARGGSKSVPRKNIALVNGLPLIAYSIRDALASERISRVVVSTDDEEIANVAREFGAEVPFLRPASLAGDFSRDIEFYLHALEWLRDNEGYRPDAIVNLRPPHPVRDVRTIDRAIACFCQHPEADSLRSVKLAEQTPYKMWLIEDGQLRQIARLPGNAEPYNSPRQALPLVYWQDGYIEISRTSSVLEHKSISGEIILPFITAEDTVDIDYPEAIVQAESLLQRSERIQLRFAS